MTIHGRPTRILLVDDNVSDVELALRAFEEIPFAGTIDVAEDGAAAIEKLNAAWRSGSQNLPHIVFLDLQMPRLDGFEVLQRVKADERFRDVQVVILTSSSRAEDRERALQLRADRFMEKPMSFDGFVRALRGCVG